MRRALGPINDDEFGDDLPGHRPRRVPTVPLWVLALLAYALFALGLLIAK